MSKVTLGKAYGGRDGPNTELFVASGLAISVDGAAGIGFGSAVIGNLPEGNLLFQGAVVYMIFAGSGSDPNLIATWVGDFSVGTTPADDGTLSAGDVDILASTPLAAATAEVSPRTRIASVDAAVGVILDNTDGSLELNLNLLIDDLSIDADGVAILATGELHVVLAVLGDD